jgi:hypothetical protein
MEPGVEPVSLQGQISTGRKLESPRVPPSFHAFINEEIPAIAEVSFLCASDYPVWFPLLGWHL